MRYVKSGKLRKHGKGKKATYVKDDVMSIYKEVKAKRELHRPDASEPKVNLTETQKIKKLISAPVKTLLNDHGKEVLLGTTALIKSNGFLDGIEKSTVLRYAIAVQMKEQYMNSFINGDHAGDPFYLNCAKVFQSEIQHYEKELGLTPAALAKIKPKEKEDETYVDPMDALLDG
jgi:hypothetical protein